MNLEESNNTTQIKMDKKDLALNYDRDTNQKFFELRLNIIKKLFKSEKHEILVDVGCGTGIFLDYLHKDFKVGIGIDNCKEMVDFAKKKHTKSNINYIIGKGDVLPLADNSANFVLSMGVLENIKDKKRHINESLRVLKKGGILFLTTPIRSMTKLYDLAKIFGKTAPRYWPISYISFRELNDLIPKEIAEVLEHRIIIFNPSNIRMLDYFCAMLDKMLPACLNRYMIGPQYLIVKKYNLEI